MALLCCYMLDNWLDLQGVKRPWSTAFASSCGVNTPPQPISSFNMRSLNLQLGRGSGNQLTWAGRSQFPFTPSPWGSSSNYLRERRNAVEPGKFSKRQKAVRAHVGGERLCGFLPSVEGSHVQGMGLLLRKDFSFQFCFFFCKYNGHRVVVSPLFSLN